MQDIDPNTRRMYSWGLQEFGKFPGSLQNDILNAVSARCAQIDFAQRQVKFVMPPTTDLNDEQWLALLSKASCVGAELEEYGWRTIY